MTVIIDGTTGVASVAGSAAAPSVTGNDTDTGMWQPAANVLAFSTGGTERLRLDSSGNLGLGVTPSGWPAGWKVIQLSGGATGQPCFIGCSSYSALGLINNAYYDGSTYRYISNGFASQYYSSEGKHIWTTIGNGTAGNTITFTQAMTLDASGNFFVGTTSALNSTSSGYANIQATGNTTPAIVAANSSTSFTSDTLRLGNGTTSGTGFNHIACYVSSGASDQFATAVFKVIGNGNAVNTNNSYGPISSDPRLKENIDYNVNYLEDLMRLRVCKFSYKTEKLDAPNQLGFLTDNVKEVFPKLIEIAGKAEDFGLPANEPDVETYKASVMLPMAIRAIQEQQAIITELTARVAQLEGAK